jgi:tRNA(Ile2) C34 agmatinyltransferase TiaS
VFNGIVNYLFLNVPQTQRGVLYSVRITTIEVLQRTVEEFLIRTQPKIKTVIKL